MTKAAELAKWGEVSTNGQVSGRRNIVINGGMNVAQRGTSFDYVTTDAYCLDRFNIDVTGGDNSAGRLTASQAAITDLPGFANALKFDCTTADTSIAAGEALILSQKFEGQDVQQLKKGTSSAEKFTVSFYVKGTAKTYALEVLDIDTTNNRSIAQTFGVTTSWNRVVLTFDGDTTGALDDDNARSLDLNFFLHAGATYTGGTLDTAWGAMTNANRAVGIGSFYSSTDNEFFITGLQMEVGSVATPFENRSFGEELALCQRYFHFSGFPKIIPGQDQDDGSLTDYEGQVFSWTLGDVRHATSYSFPTTMRSNPTVVMYGPTDGTSARSATYNSATQETVSAYYNESTNGLHGYFQGGSNTTGQRFFLGADCEL